MLGDRTMPGQCQDNARTMLGQCLGQCQDNARTMPGQCQDNVRTLCNYKHSSTIIKNTLLYPILRCTTLVENKIVEIYFGTARTMSGQCQDNARTMPGQLLDPQHGLS